MSQFYLNELEVGYAGIKKNGGKGTCNLKWCNNPRTKYKGKGERLCEEHQSKMREYGGPGRLDRPWTFHRNLICDNCGQDAMEIAIVKRITNPLHKKKSAYGMMVGDHVVPRRDGGSNAPENCQTLCLYCNEFKTTFCGDRVAIKNFNKKEKAMEQIENLKPTYHEGFQL